jgi:hypothetical protein
MLLEGERPVLHMIGLFHTVPNHKSSHCAFTGKVLRFAKMMKMYGWKVLLVPFGVLLVLVLEKQVIEYSNGISDSDAYEKVFIALISLTKL